ncbi:MAG: dihydrofolate reductase [Spirochaetota bacterium]
MTISHIAAVGRNLVIGTDGVLPWHIPDDLKHFRDLTMGKTLIMGRKTYESLPRPLAGRRIIVVSRTRHPNTDSVTYAPSIDEAFRKTGDQTECLIAGGGQIYEETMIVTNRIHLTVVDSTPPGTVRYPLFNLCSYDITCHGEAASAEPSYRYYTLERRLKTAGCLPSDYRKETGVINYSHRRIREAAYFLKSRSRTADDYVTYALHFTADRFTRSTRSIPVDTDRPASDIVRNGARTVRDRCVLLVSLLRHENIHAGFCRLEENGGEYAAAVYRRRDHLWYLPEHSPDLPLPALQLSDLDMNRECDKFRTSAVIHAECPA